MSDVMGWFGFFVAAFAILVIIDLVRSGFRALYRRWLAPRKKGE